MTKFSSHISAMFLKEESVLIYLWVKILGKHISYNCHHPKVQIQPCQGEIFVTGHIQAKFGLPSVRDLGERILSLKKDVRIRK